MLFQGPFSTVARDHQRVTPECLVVIGFHVVVMSRYASPIGWLATLRQANGLTCFRQRGTESLVQLAQIR